MGTTFQGDIPGNLHEIVENTASVASNAGDAVYQPVFRVPQTGTFVAARWVASANQAGAADHRRALKIINLGAAAAGTIVLASYDVTASKARNVPFSLTNNTTAANLALAAGDVLAFYTTKGGNGVAIVAGQVQIEWSKN